jgi:hypothetical protein
LALLQGKRFVIVNLTSPSNLRLADS